MENLKKKILITGGSGFIGSIIREKLKNLNFETVSIGRSINENVRINLNDSKLKNILNDFQPEIICHLASGSNITRAEEDKERESKNTVTAMKFLLSSLKEVGLGKTKIIYLSSQAVYGNPDILPVSESCIVSPVTHYGHCKKLVEDLIIESGFDYVIFRVSSVYGKGQDYTKSGAIAKFINKMQTYAAPVVFNSNELFSDFIYVEDVASAVLKAINSDIKNKIFNLGSGSPTKLKKVLDILYTYFPNSPQPEIKINNLYNPDKQKGIYLSIEKLKRELNWSCKYNIEEGLHEMLKDAAFITN